MRMKVPAHGLLIPPELLTGVDEVEIREEYGTLVIVPIWMAKSPPDYPLYELGSDPLTLPETDVPLDDPVHQIGAHPVYDSVTDASVNLDKYLYGTLDRE